MTLVTYTDIQEDDAATPDLWNTRFSSIVNAINGNLDSSNLADNAVSTNKITNLAVTSAKLATDAVATAKIPDNAVTTVKIADSNVTTAKIANNAITAGKVDFGGSGVGIWWQEIGRTTLGTAGDTISVTVAAKKHLKILAWCKATGGTVNSRLRFNGDTANNYGMAVSLFDGNAFTTTSVSISGIEADSGSIASGNTFHMSVDVTNDQTEEKLLILDSHYTAPGAGNFNVPLKIWGHWANTTAQITQVELTNIGGTGDFAVGSRIIVLGHD